MFSLHFIANCGYLLDYGKGKLLLDALYHRPDNVDPGADGHRVPDDIILSQIKNREGLFTDVDLLLFTHMHWDHGSEELIKEYCSRYTVQVLRPNESDTPLIYENDHIRIEGIPSTHDLMSNYDKTTHCCYRMFLDGKVFVFTGDLDVHIPIPEKLYDKPIDYLFLNVHHILVPEGRNAVNELFRPQHLFIQHVPDPENDVYGLIKRIHNKLNVYGDTLPPYTLLEEPMTQLLPGGKNENGNH